eukprot:2134848-Rhodomonas_salina.1
MYVRTHTHTVHTHTRRERRERAREGRMQTEVRVTAEQPPATCVRKGSSSSSSLASLLPLLVPVSGCLRVADTAARVPVCDAATLRGTFHGILVRPPVPLLSFGCGAPVSWYGRQY